MPELTLEVLLASLSPFKYLGRETRRALAGELREQRFEPDEVIIERGSSGKAVYLLAEGSVAVVEPASGTTPPRVRGAFEGPTYFGERAALFEDPRRACLRAAGPCRCYSLPGERFLSLIAESTPFAQALARNLREKQGIFTPLEDFLAVLVENATRGVLDLETLLERYHALRPALHGDLDKSTLDIGAWSYALARLPANITETYVLLLSRSIPDALHPPDAIAEPVPTAARRRSAWSLRRGKDLVLLREGRTDLVDFVTNLLAHATEARKLRRRLRDPRVVEALRRAAEQGRPDLPEGLGLSEAEVAGLRRLWPEDLPRKLFSLVVHHEDFTLFLDKALNNYNIDAAERWTEQVRSAAEALLGDLDGVPVEIISSNTHSVTNCLSPWLRRQRPAIFAWGAEHAPKLMAAAFEREEDRLYALARGYLKAHPEAELERAAMDREHGIVTLEQTAFTGIAVDLIDPTRLDPQALDSELSDAIDLESRRLIVNIDYAFGRQAEDILGSLVLLFDRAIRSINVLGKAGALTGRRGDLLVPTLVILQDSDEIFHVNNAAPCADRLAELSGRDVHVGPLLTVEGTLLQNRALLNYYRRLWRAVGLEMEGSYYARQIHRSRHLDLLEREVSTRFLYYTSDLPLDHSSNLSAPLAAHEGIPPLYATTRAVLEACLCDSPCRTPS